ncbi:hypothetical protein V2H45_09780 [Tumidithrix elongata RA019]|uniref:CRAL-TRIO domain-containing protein n=1 Tax=Tumidithrix elongata BACA0141 TaxID=2716417 RepID=A0AAW9PYN6_9CYAN|nr:hypothetical protein [Tumidithrix elongata RA019]
MSKRSRPQYMDKNTPQTLRQGLEEYYAVNPNVTDPRELPPEFAKILLAHDVSHVVLGCDTNMYDEIKLLPLGFWTSDFKFSDYLRTNRDPAIKPAIQIMYDDLIREHGVLWLYSSILVVLPRLLPEVISLWFKTRGTRKFYPFLDYEHLLDRSLLEIRQEFDLFPFF